MKIFSILFCIVLVISTIIFPQNILGNIENLDNNDTFGRAVANIGDLNGDGINDIVVGAPYDGDGGINTGAIYILFLNKDGTVKSHQKISASEGSFKGKLNEDDQFGRGISNIGDFDGDGITDLAVGAYHDDDGGINTGAIYILFLNKDGTVKSHQKISATEGNFVNVIKSGDCFGNAVTSIGDLDGDGITDLAVGAHDNYSPGTKAEHVGAVHILFLNKDGTVKSSQKISDTEGNFGVIKANDSFGVSVANIGDFDGDGVTDLVVGAYGDSDDGFETGAIYILFLNKDGTVKSHQKTSASEGSFKGNLNNGDLFGSEVISIGDLDGDGITDLAVGAYGDDDVPFFHSLIFRHANPDKGAIYILFLNKDGTVKSHQKISASEGSFKGNLNNGDLFGFSVANIGDLNGDGINDVIVGAPYDDDTSLFHSLIQRYDKTDKGAIYILFLNKDGTVKSHQKIPDQRWF